MKVRRVLGVFLFAAVALSASNAAVSQEKQPGAESKQPPQAGGQEMEEMMKQWLAMAAPDENHARLEPLVGAWATDVKFRMSPDAEFQSDSGTLERKWILDGRFLLEEAVSPASGPQDMPFHGFGWVGYDKTKKKYTFAWIDNHGTGIYTGLGTCDESGNTFTFTGDFDDPMTGKTLKTRTVMTIINDNKHAYEGYMPDAEGKEYCNFQMTCTRK